MEHSRDEIESDFVEVSRDLKKYVLGRRGYVIQEIRQTSGAKVSTGSSEEEGFTVIGNKKQRACAKKLILEKVREIQKRKSEEAPPGEFVEVPKAYKGLVFGKFGQNLQDISFHTGAQVIRKDGEVYIISGTEKQREQAKLQIRVKIVGARLRGVENKYNKFCVCIDGWNLPENCKLKLEQVVQRDRMVIPESDTQYRLKPAEDYDQQQNSNPTDDPNYLSKLSFDALESLRNIKQEMKTKEYLEADMWCHFGQNFIRGPDKDEADQGRWTIDEASKKFKSSIEGNCWKTALKSGVSLDEKILERHVCNKTPEEYADYAARYDLAFVTPCSHQVICKVWVTKKNVGKKLEDIPDPLSDVKNILGKIHFKDEGTRSRCRGWLVLPSRKYLQADILFPGCEFDCRLMIRGRTGKALVADYVPKEEARKVLAKYLSDLTLTDEDDIRLCLPERKIPKGFHLTYKRCSKRSVYEISPGFTVILSKESSWRSDGLTEKPRESTDFHLHCREWDDLLNSGDWEPEKIIEKLPEFLQFAKKVQVIVLERTVPPEILARGLAAVEAYNKALSSGITFVKRVPLMLIGQDRAGKTSLKKSLRGIVFDPEEDSTVGIDLSFFNVSTETWRTGEQDLGKNSDTAITFDYQTARRIVDSLKEERKSTKVNATTDLEETSSSFNSEKNKMEEDSRPTESSMDAENIQTSGVPAPTPSRHIPCVLPDPVEQKQEDVNFPTPDVPDEVASAAETLLQGDLGDNGEEIYSTLWDFAGQSVYYVTHPLFLTKKAIYFLVYDLSLNPNDIAKPLVKQGVYKKVQESFSLRTNLDYLEFWMMSVASLASSEDECPSSEVLPEKLPPVFLVCTHADTPYCARDPKELAVEIFGYLKNKPYNSHLCDVFFVDNTSLRFKNSECPEVVRLRQDVLAVTKELPQINEAIPIKWLKFEKALKAAKEEGLKCISLEKAKGIAKVCDVDEGKEFETLMNYLHDLRSLIHFDDTAELNALVVLDPQWLVDVFKKVITIKPYDPKEKKFLQLWCKLEREGILDEKLLAHVWEPLFDNKETSDSLIGIMEKFSLLCPCPSYDSSNKSYLVPSMLKSHPPKEVLELVESAKIPSLFVKFANDQVPPGFFPRMVLQFLQWGKEKKFWRPENPQLFHDFARFITTEDGYSVILMCHSSTVEVVVHGPGDLGLDLVNDLSSKMTLSADIHHDTAGETCARVVRKQLDMMLECMRNEFSWLKNMKYEMRVICPACCKGKVVDFCKTHYIRGCKQEQCLHFLTVSELCHAKEYVICTKSASAQNIRVQVMQFSPWFASTAQQALDPSTSTGTTEQAAVQGDPGNSEKALNVTLLASEWGSSMGGLSTINRNLAILLAKHSQVHVTLLVPEFACCEKDKRDAASYNIAIREAERLPAFDPLDWLNFPPKEFAIDIVLGHGAKLGRQAQVIKKSHSCKWVQVVHTAPEELGIYKNYSGAIAKGEEKNRDEVDLCKLSDLVVAVGPKLAEAYSSYLRFCKKHQDIIQLTPGTFREFTTIEQAAREGEKFKVLTFGRGDPEDFSLKGYDIAAKAVFELKDSSYCLVFVGAPSGKQDEVRRNLLQSGISEDQLFVRAFLQNKERLKELFCEVDLAIMPSRTEGFGLTALEALSAGLPILVSGNSGFAHVLRDLPSGNAFVVESKDPKEWAKAIASVRQKKRAQRLEEIQTLRSSYEEKYSWEDQCGALVEKLRSMALEDQQLRSVSYGEKITKS